VTEYGEGGGGEVGGGMKKGRGPGAAVALGQQVVLVGGGGPRLEDDTTAALFGVCMVLLSPGVQIDGGAIAEVNSRRKTLQDGPPVLEETESSRSLKTKELTRNET